MIGHGGMNLEHIHIQIMCCNVSDINDVGIINYIKQNRKSII
jgi:hypothetical protein